MVFSSLEFLFLFMAVTLPLHFLVPVKWRNAVLLAVSLVFYGWGEPVYVLLMVGTIAVDYAAGLLIGKSKDRRQAKVILIVSIVINLLILGFFKYYDFLIINLSRIPFLSFLKPLGVALPIGISFYTFQALSYVIDVYRGDALYQKNPFSFGTYVALFPQLIAGPIVRYKDIDGQLRDRKCTVSYAASGIRRFVCGLAKKVLLANSCAAMWKEIHEMPVSDRSTVISWLGIVLFAFNIYFDFSGYSDMAIGLGKIFGFKFIENFNYPYISKSITEFWRRWHISLSTWFKEYVYIPLGGNRCSKGRAYFNIFVVWLLTGLWHGAQWNFILWGLYFFVILVLEKAFLLKLIDKCPSVVRRIYALFFILFGFFIFVFDSSEPTLAYQSAIEYLKSMFFAGQGPVFSEFDVYTIVRSMVLLFICAVASTPIPKKIYDKLDTEHPRFVFVTTAATLLIFGLCVAYLVSSDFNPFLYTQF